LQKTTWPCPVDSSEQEIREKTTKVFLPVQAGDAVTDGYNPCDYTEISQSYSTKCLLVFDVSLDIDKSGKKLLREEK
jgi:hypothetical protein